MLIIIKGILIKAAVSLVVGAASSIGMQAGATIWNKTIGNRLREKEHPAEQSTEAEPA